MYIKIILIAQNAKKEMPLNPIPKHWGENFHLPYTKYVNKYKHINNNIC